MEPLENSSAACAIAYNLHRILFLSWVAIVGHVPRWLAIAGPQFEAWHTQWVEVELQVWLVTSLCQESSVMVCLTAHNGSCISSSRHACCHLTLTLMCVGRDCCALAAT